MKKKMKKMVKKMNMCIESHFITFSISFSRHFFNDTALKHR